MKMKPNGMEYKQSFDILNIQNIHTSLSTTKINLPTFHKNLFYHKKNGFWSFKRYEKGWLTIYCSQRQKDNSDKLG